MTAFGPLQSFLNEGFGVFNFVLLRDQFYAASWLAGDILTFKISRLFCTEKLLAAADLKKY